MANKLSGFYYFLSILPPFRNRTEYLVLGEAFSRQHSGSSSAAFSNTNKMHRGCQRLSGQPLKFLSTRVREVVQNSDPAAPKASGDRLCLFVFLFQPGFSVGVNPPAVLPSDGGKTAPLPPASQPLRFPLRLNEAFAVSHIVGIQHQSVYWSPCGSKLPPPQNSPSVHGISNETVQ